MPQIGQTETATLTVSPFDGTTAVVLTVYAPDGTSTTPVPTTADLGATWTTVLTYTQTGWYLLNWVVTGTGKNVASDQIYVEAADSLPPAPPIYTTLEKLKKRLGIATDDTTEDDDLEVALKAASRGIDTWCFRRFYPDTAATARVYQPLTPGVAIVDDFWTTSGLIIATGDGDDTYATTLATADRQLEPLNGIVRGQTGWPYYLIRTRNGVTFPSAIGTTLQVTAKWGWAATPDPIVTASRILAEEIFKLKDAPFGVAGYGEYGAIRVRDNPKVASMCAPYRRDAIEVG